MSTVTPEHHQKTFLRYARTVSVWILAIIIGAHFLAVFGMLMALLLLVLWSFNPLRTPCLICFYHQNIRQHHNAYCPSCRRIVTSIYNPPLRSLLINFALVLLLSNICLFGLLVEINLIFKISVNFPVISTGGNAQLATSQESVTTPEALIHFDVYIDSPTQAVNLAEADLRFDSSVLEVEEIQTDKSIANIFPMRNYSQKEGTISIIGGLTNPGFMGKGLLARIVFKRKTAEATDVVLLSSSKVLANDGKGTNLLSQSAYTKISIQQ